MRKYKATISFVVEVEADNCCAAHQFIRAQRLVGPWASSMPTPSSKNSNDHFMAAFAEFEHKATLKLEAL